MLKLDSRSDELENRSRRNNIVVYGLPEPNSESPEQLLDSFKYLMSDKLGLQCTDIERWHRLGARRGEKPRPAIFKFLDYRSKLAILKNARKLKGTQIYVNEDFSEHV